jgi:hypothetical protein
MSEPMTYQYVRKYSKKLGLKTHIHVHMCFPASFIYSSVHNKNIFIADSKLRADPRGDLPFFVSGIFANFCKSTLFFAHFCASERA